MNDPLPRVGDYFGRFKSLAIRTEQNFWGGGLSRVAVLVEANQPEDGSANREEGRKVVSGGGIG